MLTELFARRFRNRKTLDRFAAAIGCFMILGATTRAADPPIQLNKVIELFEAGKPAFGVFSYDRSPHNALALAASDLDFALVDMEHAPLDFTELRIFLMAMIDKREVLKKGNPQPEVTPLVRLPQNGREKLEFLIKQALDLGAYGLMLPHTETAEEALAVVRASRYAQYRGVPDFEPTGVRGAGYGYAARYWGIEVKDYIRRADVWPLDPNGSMLLIFQIESKRGVENVGEILKVPGVGAIFIGPADLSLSLGVEMDHPDVEVAIQRVLAAAKASGVPCGIPAFAEDAPQRLKQGFRFFTLAGGDIGMNEKAAAALKAARQAAGRDD